MKIRFALAVAVTLAVPAFASAPAKPLSEDQKVIHVLNRLGFGPRPGDVERVKRLGLKNYIDLQLHPEKIQDAAVDTKTAAFEALKISGEEVARMEREVQMSNRQLQQLRRAMAERGAMDGANAINGAVNNAVSGTQPTPAEQARRARDVMLNATPEERAMLEAGRIARQRVNDAGYQLVMNKVVRAAESEKQLYEVLVDFWSNHFNIDATKVRASKVVDEQNVIRPNVMGKFRDLLHASATSAAMMLYLDNDQSVAPQAPPQRPAAQRAAQAMQQMTLEALREASKQGRPAAVRMLAQLQERAKAAGITEEEAFKRLQQAQPAARRQTRGLNENYARELMELHTLGVDGGYTQKDVTELARCLTGWGVRGGRYSGEFEFRPNLHDRGEKVVLGKTIPAGGGMEEGKMVLDMLASHPSTMRHISTKLCRRFVADNPPKSLVDRCVETWKRTDGDLREVVRCIVTSKEFFSPDAYKQKVKSPFEYVISSVRALGGGIEVQAPATDAVAVRRPAAGINVFAPNGSGQVNPRVLCGQIGTLGQPLFNYGFPTGYPEESTKWVSSGALIGRINFALNLVNGRILDVNLGSAVTAAEALKSRPLPEKIDQLSKSLLGTTLSSSTRSTLIKQLGAVNGTQPSLNDEAKSEIMDDVEDDSRRLAALILGSPEFQRR